MSLSKRLINTGGGDASGPSFYGMRYTGNNSNTYRDFTGFGFQPDMIWIKGNNTSQPAISTLMGGFAQWVSPYSSNGYMVDNGNAYPLADGITVGGAGGSVYNANGINYDVFAWKAGNGTETNTDGTIQSTVSANPANGISIVTWSGNLTNGATIGHGLNSAPELVIVKRTNGSSNWLMGGAAMGNNSYMLFNSYGETINTSNTTRFQTFNDTTFSVGTSDDINGTSKSYIAYCFHSVEGFSKIGVVNTNNAAGTVATSFAPKFFLGRSLNCGFPAYMKNKYMSDYFYSLDVNTASNRGPGLNLNTDNFQFDIYFNNHLRCGNLLYATFGNDLM